MPLTGTEMDERFRTPLRLPLRERILGTDTAFLRRCLVLNLRLEAARPPVKSTAGMVEELATRRGTTKAALVRPVCTGTVQSRYQSHEGYNKSFELESVDGGDGRRRSLRCDDQRRLRMLLVRVRTTTSRLVVLGRERREPRLLRVPRPRSERSVRGRALRRIPTPRMDDDLERRRIPQPVLLFGDIRMDMFSPTARSRNSERSAEPSR